MKRHVAYCRRRKTARRRGAVMMLVLVCLLIAGVLMATVVRSTTLRRAQQRQELARVQASWLAESGLARAAARLRSDPEYRGETWLVPADALGGRAGQVELSVAPDPLDDRRWKITAVGAWPRAAGAAAARSPAQVTRTTTQPKPPTGGEEP